jgi:hypothetical protein
MMSKLPLRSPFSGNIRRKDTTQGEHIDAGVPDSSPPSHDAAADIAESASLWERAEQALRENPEKRKILDEYHVVVRREMGSQIQPGRELSKLLSVKVQNLKDSAWKIETLEIRKIFIATAETLLKLQTLVTTSTTASPPATIACAGVFCALTVC